MTPQPSQVFAHFFFRMSKIISNIGNFTEGSQTLNNVKWLLKQNECIITVVAFTAHNFEETTLFLFEWFSTNCPIL